MVDAEPLESWDQAATAPLWRSERDVDARVLVDTSEPFEPEARHASGVA
jgi:hypothetical protein